jgi:type VI protein secretion system component Hcp
MAEKKARTKKGHKKLTKSKKLEATRPLRVKHADLSVTKPVDAASPTLML